MNAKEAQAAFAELKKEVGGDAEVYARLDASGTRGIPLHGSIYPRGILARGEKVALHFEGADWSSLLAAGRAKWEAYRGHHQAETIRKMALEIIRVTAEQGECSDAALRLQFSAEDVTRYADEACEEADRMASNGPFSVTRTEVRSNAPADPELAHTATAAACLEE